MIDSAYIQRSLLEIIPSLLFQNNLLTLIFFNEKIKVYTNEK